jgi:acyl-coenzyme A synthetase/AMP-(fatty) acid ligase
MCGEKDWERVDDPNETPAAYVSTSGTSGTPKAAVLSHSYFVSQAEFQVRTADVRYEISNLIALPPFHVFTIPLQHALPLRKGTTTYIMPRFEVQNFVSAVEKFRIARTAIVPPILKALAIHSESSQLRSLRKIYVAGSCATDGMQQQLYAKLSPSARIENVYGMTEAGWLTTRHGRKQDNTGSVGRPLPGTKFR